MNSDVGTKIYCLKKERPFFHICLFNCLRLRHLLCVCVNLGVPVFVWVNSIVDQCICVCTCIFVGFESLPECACFCMFVDVFVLYDLAYVSCAGLFLCSFVCIRICMFDCIFASVCLCVCVMCICVCTCFSVCTQVFA